MSGRIRFEVCGAGPTVLLSAGLGGLGSFWAPQIAALRDRFRVVTYDQRGTGANAEALPSDYRIAHMADDVADILRQLDDEPVHFVGHAFGGLVGLDMAVRMPGTLRSLTVVNGWAKVLDHTLRCFDVRLEALAAGGPASYLRAQPIFLYPAAWLEDNKAAIEQETAAGLGHFQGEDNLLARLRALEAFDVRASLGGIATPTLIVGAQDDVLVPVQASERLARDLPNARLHRMHGGHSCCRTEVQGFNDALLSFLRETAEP